MRTLFKNIWVGIILLGCSISLGSAETQNMKVLSVSDFSYTMGGKQAVYISIGTDKDHYFAITTHRDQIKPNAHITRPLKMPYDSENEWKTKVIDAEISNKGTRYFFLMRDNKASWVVLEIYNMDFKKRVANLAVKIRLCNADNDKYIEIEGESIKVSGEMFDNLIKKM